jgi:hypothetical protein
MSKGCWRAGFKENGAAARVSAHTGDTAASTSSSRNAARQVRQSVRYARWPGARRRGVGTRKLYMLVGSPTIPQRVQVSGSTGSHDFRLTGSIGVRLMAGCCPSGRAGGSSRRTTWRSRGTGAGRVGGAAGFRAREPCQTLLDLWLTATPVLTPAVAPRQAAARTGHSGNSRRSWYRPQRGHRAMYSAPQSVDRRDATTPPPGRADCNPECGWATITGSVHPRP